jgi:hypothetical protein
VGNIQITRYANPEQLGYSGYIEPDDASWIIFLDSDGNPDVYFAQRDETGAVVGPGIDL